MPKRCSMALTQPVGTKGDASRHFVSGIETLLYLKKVNNFWNFNSFNNLLRIYIYICNLRLYINIYMVNPPGPIRALGAGVVILDNYKTNMITYSKTLQIPVKNASWMKMTLHILTFHMDKNPISWNQNLALKRIKCMFKLQTLCMKNAPDSSKSCLGIRNASRGTIICKEWQYIISQYICNGALGFENQRARNLQKDKKNPSWLQSVPNLHRDKKSLSFELQSARNLHRDKKHKKTKALEGYLPLPK